jgi:NAD(P)-dependent dehydrogenase (short-subunit alcohol dehydrogenase family)
VSAPALPAQIALIVGAAGPRGRVLAVALAEAGMAVALAAGSGATREAFAVNSVANELWAIGRRSLVLEMDFRQPPSVAEAVRRALNELGPIDLLINAGEYAEPRPFAETPETVWQQCLDLNLSAVYLTCHAVGQAMLDRGAGRILNIVSTVAVQGRSESAPLAAAQAGVVGLTRSLAAEWRGRVAVNGAVTDEPAGPLGPLAVLLASAPIELSGHVFEL